MKREELNGKFFMESTGGMSVAPENSIDDQANMLEAKDLLREAEKTKQKEINDRLATLEMYPTINRLVILPYPKNPYRKIMEGEFVVDYDGSFDNPDSGERDATEAGITCAKVVEVGPECKHVQPGDDVYYDSRGAYPLPYMSQGFKIMSEPQVLSIVAEGLEKRFKENGN